MLSISVVICCYTFDRWEELKAAINSVWNQRSPTTETIVVVDHNDKLLQAVKSEFPQITAVENRNAQGLSGARNTGVAMAHGEIIAFLDDDAIAAPDWLEKIQNGYHDENVIAVGGAITPLWQDQKPGWLPEEFYWVVGCTYKGSPTKEAAVRNLIGANMSFRRNVFEEVGWFREGIGRLGTIPYGCEETELCIRVLQQWPHKTILFTPQAVVQHHVTPQRTTWSYFFSRCFAEGQSKALVTATVGSRSGLSSELTYSVIALPRGVIMGLLEGVFRLDIHALKRSFAIVFGFSSTLAGYVVGKLATIRKSGIHATSSKLLQKSS